MKYLLDTNAVIAAIAGEAAVISWLNEEDVSDFGVSSAVMHELNFGRSGVHVWRPTSHASKLCDFRSWICRVVTAGTRAKSAQI